MRHLKFLPICLAMLACDTTSDELRSDDGGTELDGAQRASDMAVPDMAVPDMAVPDVAVPDMAVPDMAVPDMAVPDMAVPDMALPDMALPDAFECPGPVVVGPNDVIRYFVSEATPVGGGIEAFDEACNTSPLRPEPCTEYKALVMGSQRRACTSANCANGPDALDWPLLPNRQYGHDGSPSFTTNANAIVTEETTNGHGVEDTNFWSGGDRDWLLDAENTCGDWRDNGEAMRGAVGWTGGTFASFQGGHGLVPCHLNYPILCVEVPAQ